jgi:hypothetical protein
MTAARNIDRLNGIMSYEVSLCLFEIIFKKIELNIIFHKVYKTVH